MRLYDLHKLFEKSDEKNLGKRGSDREYDLNEL